MKKLTLFFALLLGMFLFPSVETHAAAVPRVMAYDLHLDMSTTGFVKFCYTLNTDAEKVYIIMYAPNGEVAWRRDITGSTRTKKGPQSWTWSQLDLPSFKGMTWAIEAQGAAVSTFACTNDVSGTTTKYKFNRPQGVAIDNNTESDFFGRMYIALPKGGYDHTKGIVVFDPVHNVLSNGGITATDVTLGDDDRLGMHRIAVDPTTNKVYYAKSESPTAVYELTPNATSILFDGGTAKNIVDGLGFTRVDAICFDVDGNMFVMDNCNISTGGTLYKVKNGVKTKILQNGIWGVTDIGMAPDGKGGIWIAQNRSTVTTDNLAALSHVNANGETDYVINKNATDEMKALCPNNNGNAGFRGQCAYNANEDILAFAGNYMVTLFKVTYDSNNKPRLERWKDTGKITSGKNIDGIAFDYAGNLVFLSAQTERFYHYAVPTDNNTCITPAKKSSIFDGAPVARVFAYGLNVVDNGNSYTFSFTPNATAKSGRIIVYNGETKVQVKEFAIDAPITKGVKKEMTISKWNLPKLAGMTWAVELTGEKVESLAVLNNTGDTDKYRFYRPQGVAIDNNPESDFFGRMYIAYPEDNGVTVHKEGIVVFDPLHKSLKSTSIKPTGVGAFSNGQYEMHRIAVNPVNNKVYYTKSMTGTAIYEMTPNATNVLSDGGTAKNVISGITAITNANSLCFDEEGTMYVLANANYSGGYTGKIYKVSNGTATEFTTQSYDWAAKDNAIVSDGRGGFWVAQHREDFGSEDVLSHINSVGVRDFYVDKNTNANLLVTAAATSGKTNASYRGQIAYYQIDTNTGILAFGGGKVVSLFNVSYSSDGVPTLEKLTKTGTIGTNIDGLAFDYAGNLVVLSASSERFYHYTVPTDNNVCITPAKSTLTINGPGVSVPRVFAYDLKSELVTPGYDQYRLSFKSNVPYKSGNIVFLNEAGVQVGEKLAITANPMIINRTDLPADMVNWGVELSSDRCTSVDEYTDASKGIYDFYNPQGIAVDNSPESNYFGQIYIAAATNGDATKGKTARTKNQKQGIFVYSPELKELNLSNVGYMPSNVTLSGNDLFEIHRIAVDPKSHNLVWVNSVNNTPAIWAMNPANMMGEATNLFTTGMTTRTNSLCYDNNGVLYVMDASNIYNNDTQTKLVSSSKWVNSHNAIASDGRDGFWVAQFQGNWSTYQILAHVNSSNQIDFYVDNNSSDAVKALFPYGYGIAQRGQLAYYEKEQLLAFAGNGQASIFKVTYNASGVPSIALYARTAMPSTANVDGMAFDFAGNLYVGSGVNNGKNAGEQRFYAFSVPTNNNTCLTPAKKALVLTKEDVNVTVDENNNDITGTVAPYANQPASITLVRDLHLYEWNTLTLPFGMDAAQIEEAFGVGTKVAMLTTSRIKSTNSVYIGFSYVNQIEAGKPYLINPTKQVTEDIVPVIINTSTQTISTTILDMIPVLDEETWVANENNFFLGPDAYLYQDAADGVMPPLRAYFQFHGLTSQQLSNIRARVAFGEDEATDLEDLEIMDEPMSQEEAIKVIENGQLYIIHGGVKYNIQGQVIR